MEQKKLDSSAPNLLNLCVDHYEKGECRGRLYHWYAEEPVCFEDIKQLFISMDAFFDWLGYPQASNCSRSFKKQNQPMIKKMRRGDKAAMKKNQQMLNCSGEEATFVVHVKFRQNATWQGKVSWIENQQSCNFRSALELLKIIDNAMEDCPNEKKEAVRVL